jgi:hypothetical protein
MGEPAMSAFTVVRFRAKPGMAEDFQKTFSRLKRELPGLRRIVLVKTGERDYCSIGEFEEFDHTVRARPTMKTNLDEMRALLEPFSEELGVTDPVSGHAAFDSGDQ